MAPKRKAEDARELPAAPPNAQEDTQPAPAGRVDRRKQFEEIAKRRASHFARYEDGEEGTGLHAGGSDARELGPWSSAAELANKREGAREERMRRIQEGLEAEEAAAVVAWTPRRDVTLGPRHHRAIPSLFALACSLVADHIEEVPSLQGVPDAIKSRIASDVCKRRKVTEEVVKLFSEAAPSELILQDCTALEPASLEELLKECLTARLEALQLQRCGRGLTDAVAHSIKSSIQASYAQRAGGDFSVCSSAALSHLSLMGAFKLTDAGLRDLLLAMPHLRSLSLEQCSRVTDAALTLVRETLAPGLRNLNLSYCTGLGKDALVQFFTASPLPALQGVHLEGVLAVDDDVLRAIGDRCTALQELSVASCSRCTEDGVAYIAGKAGSRLRSLDVSKLARMSDAALDAIVEHCPSLTTFRARHCGKLTDEGLARLCSHLKLQHLSITSNDLIRAETAKALASHCRDSLQTLELSFCRSITNEGLGLVADACAQFRVLTIFGCAQITSTFLDGHSNDGLQVIM